MSKAIVFFLISILAIIQIVNAQTDDLSNSILRILFGKLPAVCQNSLLSSDCIYCFGFIKVLPFLFFFAIIYFFLAFAILGSVKIRVQGQTQTPAALSQLPTYQGIVLLLSIIVAILVLNLPPLDTGIPEFLLRIRNFQNFLFYLFGVVMTVTFMWNIIQPLHDFVRIAVTLGVLGIITAFFINTQTVFINPVDVIDNPCFLA